MERQRLYQESPIGKGTTINGRIRHFVKTGNKTLDTGYKYFLSICVALLVDRFLIHINSRLHQDLLAAKTLHAAFLPYPSLGAHVARPRLIGQVPGLES